MKWIVRIGTFIGIAIIWQVLGSHLNPLFISTPSSIASAFFVLFTGTGRYAIVPATLLTLEQTSIGFALAIAVGLPLGLLIGMFRYVGVSLDPYVSALYVTPGVALVPLIIIWFGIGFSATVATVLLLSVFPIMINTIAGVRDISKSLLDTAQVFGVKGLRRFRRVIFPSAFPFFMAGLRLGIGAAFTGVIVAQMLLALSGLGYLVTSFGDYFDTPELMAVIIELMALGVISTLLIQYVEKKTAYWKQAERAFR